MGVGVLGGGKSSSRISLNRYFVPLRYTSQTKQQRLWLGTSIGIGKRQDGLSCKPLLPAIAQGAPPNIRKNQLAVTVM